MRRSVLAANLFSAFCVAAFAVALTAAPVQAGRDVKLTEATDVQGAACGTTTSTSVTWCVIACGRFSGCLWNTCQACGCPSDYNPGPGIFNQTTTPCKVGNCAKYTYIGGCTGS